MPDCPTGWYGSNVRALRLRRFCWLPADFGGGASAGVAGQQTAVTPEPQRRA